MSNTLYVYDARIMTLRQCCEKHLKYQLLLNYSYCMASIAQRWFKAGNKNKSCVSYVESLYCDKKFRLIFPYHTLNVSKMLLQEICNDGD